ncbi:orotidine-5'-phosphate decarboxylase [Pragia fontium]|uniref:Orotidine 5'-phosphate decarboxylase n=2 Tax=Pragia fontium TaxID=82985 RepID=A0AAJ4W9E7_9GAMM|nr:orotidine-5'-phosphate decarboxylase [Pragia fontium]GKX61888.1 orotidine 5'-phosphate decarboxylase [Pragia fontium]SFC47947.1 orotidine-5'-phosphate decarboxylase [Pragia fontium DSM 5563 = ATCC 49100]
MSTSPIIVALDYDNQRSALELADKIAPKDCRLKIGKEMFSLCGPELVRELHQRGFDVFLDLKFHDIPNTVAKSVAAAAELGVWMVDVHASGGARMLKAAKTALLPYGKDAPKLIAVTVLTSMDESDLRGIGIQSSLTEHAERLARLAKDNGLDGVVCSAHEANHLKSLFGAEFQLVTPGIRPVGSELGDQRRVMTPPQALAAGVDYMVIGRPITQSVNPAQALQDILASLR